MKVNVRPAGSWVFWTAIGLILVQLALRGWAISQSWFRVDDLQILARLNSEGLSWATAFEPWAGHLTVINWVLPWLTMQTGADPLDFTLPAIEVMALTTIVNVGCLVFLVTAFGWRKGILPPLALFLFSAVNLPSFMWLTSATNKSPVLAVLFWGGAAHLCYLRSRRLTWAVVTMLVTTLGLFSFEKTLYVYVLYAFLALGYFATGDIIERLVQIWRTYWAGVVVYSVVIGGYLAFYVAHFLNFTPGDSDGAPQAELAWYASLNIAAGLVGGPFTWDFLALEGGAKPGEFVGLVSIAVIVTLAVELAKTRHRSKRAWILPATFLAVDVFLLAGTRATLTGPETVGAIYRYFVEMSAAAAIALALASMPLRGARESAEPRSDSALVERPKRVAAATAAMAVLATYSTVAFVQGRVDAADEKDFYDRLRASAASFDGPINVLDVGIPSRVLWSAAYPYNTASRQLPLVSDQGVFPDVATNSLYMISDSGDLLPVTIDSRRTLAAGRDGSVCAHADATGTLRMPLSAPAFGYGWLVRVGYAASADSAMVIQAGDATFETELEAGFHSVFFKANGDRFDDIWFTGIDPDVKVCVNTLVLGTPRPIGQNPLTDDPYLPDPSLAGTDDAASNDLGPTTGPTP
ncbi:MAG: hypothetical protein ACSLEW_00715 [Nocardioides sp.]